MARVARFQGGRMGPVAAAALAYFTIVVGAGWIFGPIREFALRSGADPLFASLVEAPAMALVMVYAIGWSIRTFGIGPSIVERLGLGIAALVLTLAAEFVGEILLRGRTAGEFLDQFSQPTGLVFATLLALMAVLPLVRVRPWPSH